MQKINFSGGTKNLYHTLKVIDKQPLENGGGYSITSIITGFTKETISEGDELIIWGQIHTVIGAIERRDHAGTFLNSEDKKGTFFSLTAKSIKLSQPTN